MPPPPSMARPPKYASEPTSSPSRSGGMTLARPHSRSLAGQLAGSSDARVDTADHDHIHRVRERPPAAVRKRRRLLLPKHSPLDPFKGRFVAALCHRERVALAGGVQRRVALALGA